jgi:hypothetical protein
LLGNVLVFLLISAVAMVVLALCRLLQRSTATVRNGWRYLTPGPVTWIGMALNFSFAALLSYIYLFVGSARADAAFQLTVLLILAVVFNLIAIFIAYTTIAEEVSWNDLCVRRRTLVFEMRMITWHQLARLGSEPSGYWWITAYDGPKIRFSPYNNGFSELLAKIIENLPANLPPAETEMVRAAVLVRAS